MKTGVELISDERQEQIQKHGFAVVKDAEFYQQGELLEGAKYALTLEREYYPASWDFWFHDKLIAKEARMSEQEFWIERLKIAGALIAAELDRIQTNDD